MHPFPGSPAAASPRHQDPDAAIRQMLTDTVGKALAIRPDKIDAPDRGPARIAFARQLAIYLARTRLGLSFTDAGQLFRRDRTTAAHACRRVEELRDDAAIDAMVEQLEQLVVPPVPERGVGL